MERSEIRDLSYPHYASLHAGYRITHRHEEPLRISWSQPCMLTHCGRRAPRAWSPPFTI